MMFAAQWHGKKKVEVHSEWDEGGWSGMIRAAWSVFDSAEYVVSYNGASFDSAHLRAAWAELGMPPPSPWREIDLYRTVKKFRWPSRKLEFVCKQLGLEHKTDPGGFKTWTDILDGEGKVRDAARKRMAAYCANDVKITTALYFRILPWIDGLAVPLFTGEDEAAMACNRCGSEDLQRRGWAYTTTTKYRRWRCNDCGGWARSRKSESIKTVLASA
jgi:hypothetical protein